MVKLLMLQISLLLVSIFTLTYASVQTENLGQLNLQPGFAARLYTSSLRGPDDYHRRPDYFKERDFLKDSQLIAQNVVNLNTINPWLPYQVNTIFGFFVDPTLADYVVEMRGYIKPPVTGNFSIRTHLFSGWFCNDDLSSVYMANHWIVKDSISLNETSDGFICSYNSSDVNYKDLIFERKCTGFNTCGYYDYTFHTVTTVVEDQYYPVVLYIYISGNILSTDWTFAFNDTTILDNFDGVVFHDPNDDFEADDASLNSGFPDACPHFHEEIFTATSFVKMSRTDDYNCPTPTSSSILPPSSSSILAPSSSSILAPSSSSILPPSSSSILPPSSSSILPPSSSSILPPSSLSILPPSSSSILPPSSSSILPPSSSSILPSSTSSSNSVSTNSSEPNSVATSSSIASSSGSKISSADPSSTTSSMTGTSSMSKYQSSRSGTSKASDPESESESVSSSNLSTKTSSNSESVASSFSDTSLESSLSSTAGKPMYTANSTVSHSEHSISTSKSTAMVSSSTFTSENADGNAILSTATITESEIDTLRTTTCPETEHPPNAGKTNPSLTSCEETVLPSQESLSSKVTKTTVGPDGVAVTYTECAGCTALQENIIAASGENSKLSTDTADNAAPAHSTDIVPVKESALISGEPAVYSSHSTAVAVQVTADEGRFLTYEPLLLGLSILMTFL